MFDVNEYKARKLHLHESTKTGLTNDSGVNRLAKFAGVAFGVWFLWGLFVFGCAAGVLYVIFHFISKFW
jgi:hypothetical protein